MVYATWSVKASENPGAPLSGGILLPCAGTRPGARSAEGFSRPTSQVSLTLNLLGKNRLGVCKTPILLRKTALLAACRYPIRATEPGPKKRP